VSPRRQSSLKSHPAVARDVPSTAERLEQLEATLHTIELTLDIQFKRIAALQAEVDHLAAKTSTR
jgi:hypothetical protein